MGPEMSAEKYQIKEKAYYLNLLLLKDDLKYFHKLLGKSVKDPDDWLGKLRNTRQVFLILDNVREAAKRIKNLKGPQAYIEQTRNIRKTLNFVNHFRNKAIGHLDHTLLERAVQWTPSLFSEDCKGDDRFQTIEGNKAVIEASINSFIDEEGIQKVFKTEIDLMYPPDYESFYKYLWEVVTDSIDWISEALVILSSQIKYHSPDEMHKIASIAGKTEFDLSLESDITYDEMESKKSFEKAVEKLKDMGTDQKIIALLESMNNKIVI
jgi:hypothetical protein